jgi:hypothetical protein
MDTYIRALAAQEIKVKQEHNTEKKQARNKEALKKVAAEISNSAGVNSWIFLSLSNFCTSNIPIPLLYLKNISFSS